MARTLTAGAKFVLDYGYVAESLLPNFRDSRGGRLGEFYFLQQSAYDPARGRYDSEITIIRGTQIETKAYSARVYTYSEVCKLLSSAGFATCHGFASLTRDPYKLASPRLLLVACKD